MELIIKNDIKKKEKKLKLEEKQAIKTKAKFIMKHSKELLENMKNNYTFVESLLGYFLSSNLDESEINLMVKKQNLYDYSESLSVIFELCYILPSLGYSSEECENFRNILRLYTKHFSEKIREDGMNNRQLVKINIDKANDIISKD